MELVDQSPVQLPTDHPAVAGISLVVAFLTSRSHWIFGSCFRTCIFLLTFSSVMQTNCKAGGSGYEKAVSQHIELDAL